MSNEQGWSPAEGGSGRSKERLEKELEKINGKVEETLNRLIMGELEGALTKTSRRGLMDSLLESFEKRNLKRAEIKEVTKQAGRQA